MPINPVLLQNQQDKIPEIYKDFRTIKRAVAPDEKDTVLDEAFPVYGQINDIEEHIKNKNFDTAGAITSLAVLKGPEEIDELFSAAGQIKQKFKGKNYEHPYDYTKAELESSFFRDSTLAKHMNYRSKGCVFPKASNWLLKKDISFLDTKLGNLICKIFNIDFTHTATPLESITSIPDNKCFLEAVEFNTKSFPKEIVGRALARTSKIGSLALATIEGLDIKNDIQDGANPYKEIAKGVAKLGATISGIGILGAIGSKYYGPVGSVVGASAGTVLGALVAKELD
ncbi:MAG: hypothetical protein E7Z92_05350 [Cyanobacteria bacterium SIG31]|nr:hypothetical protein [Cyanobacteria bacterium SIG31]